MFSVAITGSICTGKSFVCRILTKMGFPIFYCDAEVHKLLKRKRVVSQIKCEFPNVFVKGKISRHLLGDIVFKDFKKRQMLEDIIYPGLIVQQNKFIQKMRSQKVGLAFFEVPLLYEKQMAYKHDFVILTYAPEKVMRRRAIKRKLDLKRFAAILKTQIKSAVKKAKADYPLNTDCSRAALVSALKNIITDIYERNHSGS